MLRIRMQLLWSAVVVAAVVFPSAALAQRKAKVEFSDEAVAEAIKRGKAFLWSKYIANPGRTPWPEGQTPFMVQQDGTRRVTYDNRNYGGWSALAIYALLTAGEDYKDPRMKRALDWLGKFKTDATYSLAVRCQIWEKLPRNIGRKMLAKEAGQIIKSLYRPVGKPARDPLSLDRYGAHNVTSAGRPGTGVHDNSNTQFGILGVWAAARAGGDVPKWYWELTYQHWKRTQKADGAWSYTARNEPDNRGFSKSSAATMTAGAIASMYVAIDNLQSKDFLKCGGRLNDPAIKRGLEWLDNNFHADRSVGGQGGKYYYYLYALERTGLATGMKYIGKKDWYKLCATNLINTQRPDGAWDPYNAKAYADTCFALLFLTRGRAPVMLNRLDYDGDWNNRPRAAANLTRWVSRTFERDVNWQVINLKVPAEEWHDSPILMISGTRKPKFADEHKAKLLKFIRQGGMLLSVAECGSRGRGFDSEMRKLYAEFFPSYELSQLAADDVLFNIHFKLKKGMKAWRVSNGVRTLALHTTTDIVLPWQKNAKVGSRRAFELGANIAIYANGRSLGRPRGTSPWPAKKAIAATRRARVARVKYGGNWNVEPLAWERLKLIMANEWKTDVTISKPLTLGELDAKAWPLAAITGTGPLMLSVAEKGALKAYVQAGGMVLMDAAGGSKAFADSAIAVVEEAFGKGSVQRLGAASPVYKMAGMEISSVKYRKGVAGSKPDAKAPRLRAVMIANRPAVIISKDDLTTALLGSPVYDCKGYAPESAVKLVRNIVLYAAGKDKAAGG